MAAQITIFAATGTPNNVFMSCPIDPVETYTATFTALNNGLMEVWANAADVTLTLDGKTWKVPSGQVRTYGIRKGATVTVA